MNTEESIERIKRKITIGECEKNIGIPVYISDLKAVLSELETYKTKYENLKVRNKGTKEALRVSEDLEKHFSEEASILEAELEKKDKIIKEMVRIDPHIYRVANIRLVEREGK